MAAEERVTYLEYISDFNKSVSQRILGTKEEDNAESAQKEANEVDFSKEESSPLEHARSEQTIKIGSVRKQFLPGRSLKCLSMDPFQNASESVNDGIKLAKHH